jgi:hypothetical protein
MVDIRTPVRSFVGSRERCRRGVIMDGSARGMAETEISSGSGHPRTSFPPCAMTVCRPTTSSKHLSDLGW